MTGSRRSAEQRRQGRYQRRVRAASKLPCANGATSWAPSWAISAVAVAEKGALPSYTHGYYGRSNRFYKEWDAIARDRDTFTLWLDENVYSKEENN